MEITDQNNEDHLNLIALEVSNADSKRLEPQSHNKSQNPTSSKTSK